MEKIASGEAGRWIDAPNSQINAVWLGTDHTSLEQEEE